MELNSGLRLKSQNSKADEGFLYPNTKQCHGSKIKKIRYRGSVKFC